MAAPRARFYFDFISPFSFLAWRRLSRGGPALALEPVPVLLAAILDRVGQKGPAEIPAKRAFTYRFALWQAEREGVALRFPPTHPFNPLPALRLCAAAGATPAAVDAVFEHLWLEGRAGDTPEALAPVARRLGIDNPAAAIGAGAAKAAIRDHTEAALAAGVFGVPTVEVDGELFFGNDALPMLADWLADRARFGRGAYAALASLEASATRR